VTFSSNGQAQPGVLIDAHMQTSEILWIVGGCVGGLLLVILAFCLIKRRGSGGNSSSNSSKKIQGSDDQETLRPPTLHEN